MPPVSHPALLLTVSALQQLRRALFDNPFAGIHQLDWFDWAMLIPYFGLLFILSIYGMHRYEMIRSYFKHRKKLPQEPPARFEQLPPVTIQLPLYNERYVVERLHRGSRQDRVPAASATNPGPGRFHRRDPRLCRKRWSHVTRPRVCPSSTTTGRNRHGYKAGALQEGLKTATGELIAVFDADFVPPHDFLMRTVHFFTDPQVGTVQTRWSYLNRDFNVLTEIQAILLDGHFVLEHGARYGRGLFFNFNGTAGILRRRMIEDAGGWQHDTLTEDCDLSYRAQLKGWRFVYLPALDCPSELPVEMHGFQVQQSRWAKGLTQVAKKLLPGHSPRQAPLADQGRGHHAPHPQHLLPHDDGGLGADAAGDDLPLLHGLVPDGVHRSAADRRLLLVDLGLLRARASANCFRAPGSGRSSCCRR